MNAYSFLPEGYQEIEGNKNYLTLQEGETRVRLLSGALFGWQENAFVNNKPVCYPFLSQDKKPNLNCQQIMWAIVWNYNIEAIQIFANKSATIRKELVRLATDSNWGNPIQYDIVLMRMVTQRGPKNEILKSAYSCRPMAKSPLLPEIKEAFYEKPCYLNALIECKDPWAFYEHTTPLAMVSDGQKVQPLKQQNVKIEQPAQDLPSFIRSRSLDSCFLEQFLYSINRTEESVWEKVSTNEGAKNTFLKQYKEYADQQVEEVPF